MTPEPVDPSPKLQPNVPVLGVAAEALKKTSWLIAGAVGENVKLAVTPGVMGDTVIVLAEVDACPRSLVTVSVTLYAPACEYRCDGVTPEPVDPSPKFQLKVAVLGVDAEALKNTS